MDNVVVYVKEDSDISNKLLNILKLISLNYTVKKLNIDFSGEEFYSIFGYDKTFPQTKNNNQIIGGISETMSWLKENNYI